MAQILRSSKIDNGTEFNVRYTYYLSNAEDSALFLLLQCFFVDVDGDFIKLKKTLGETRLILLKRLLNSIERSI